jgi:hypothetical protein
VDKLLQGKMQKLKDMGADRWLKEKHPDIYEKIKKLENE